MYIAEPSDSECAKAIDSKCDLLNLSASPSSLPEVSISTANTGYIWQKFKWFAIAVTSLKSLKYVADLIISFACLTSYPSKCCNKVFTDISNKLVLDGLWNNDW